MRRTNFGLALALLAGMGLTGCDTGASDADMARVRVLLTDAPGDLARAEVTISEIYLQGSEGRVSLFTGPATYDLLTLQAGATAELAEVPIPAGSYSDLRFVVESATVTTLEGRSYSTEDGTLQCPSCAQSGLKVKLPGGAVRLESDSEVILLDFDVAQSFGKQAGRSGRWVMHPVIHASDFQTAARANGSVVLAEGVTLPAQCGGAAVTLAHFVPTATLGELVVSGNTTAEGTLRFSFLAPGTYTLGYRETVTFDNGETLTFTATSAAPSLTIGGGANPAASYTITGATCTAA